MDGRGQRAAQAEVIPVVPARARVRGGCLAAPPLQSLRSSAARMAGRRAAAMHLGVPRAVLSLQHVERLDGIAVVVEADRAAEAGEPFELGEMIADLGAVGFEIFRLA